MGGNHLTTKLMLALALLLTTLLIKGVFTAVELHSVISYSPASPLEHRAVVVDRRRLEPFQLCLDCRCCAVGAPSNCSMMPCCFGIDCNLPDKPFGVCAFVPKTCNCTACQ
ncbi:hypothetical protein Cni_G05450 [Canna indica]|uniref:DUF7866 domain-containing protein n=1 Tax=Canna indica TaxID=4628 RepID=A0AAQ3Q3S2_9LILI|nr:hypothetical protein Cni_G05450 [Canna indica]